MRIAGKKVLIWQGDLKGGFPLLDRRDMALPMVPLINSLSGLLGSFECLPRSILSIVKGSHA